MTKAGGCASPRSHWDIVPPGAAARRFSGPVALAWVDRLHEVGQSWWQSLPLGPTGYGNSPYQSLSSFAGNELLVSPDGLIEEGLLRASDCAGASFPAAFIDYDTVIPFKHLLFKTAWTAFRNGACRDLRPAYEQFCDVHRHWLEVRTVPGAEGRA